MLRPVYIAGCSGPRSGEDAVHVVRVDAERALRVLEQTLYAVVLTGKALRDVDPVRARRAVARRRDRVVLCGRRGTRAWTSAGFARPIPLRTLGAKIEALSRTSFRPAVAPEDMLPRVPSDPRVDVALSALANVRVGGFDDWAVIVGVSTSTLRNAVRAEYGLSLMDVWYPYLLALREAGKREGVTVRQLSPDLGYANDTACYRALRVAGERFGAEIL